MTNGWFILNILGIRRLQEINQRDAWGLSRTLHTTEYLGAK